MYGSGLLTNGRWEWKWWRFWGLGQRWWWNGWGLKWQWWVRNGEKEKEDKSKDQYKGEGEGDKEGQAEVIFQGVVSTQLSYHFVYMFNLSLYHFYHLIIWMCWF